MLLNLVQDYLCLEEHGKQEQNKSIIGLLSPTEQSLLIDDLVGEIVRSASLCSWHLAIDNLIEEYARTFFYAHGMHRGQEYRKRRFTQ